MGFFRQDSSSNSGSLLTHGKAANFGTRRSSGLAELSRRLASPDPLCVLDLGSTSPANIRFLTDLGHKTYSEDVLTASTDPTLVIRDDQNKPHLDEKRP